MSIKISELTPKGANLEATDLLEISESTADGYSSKSITGAEIITASQEGMQPTLVSGTNIKTINSTSLLGSGDVAVQSTLVSGTNIKTINGNSLLGSGDLVIGGGLTIGTTAITSGTVGRILFEGTGNVVQESANLFWDNTNNRLSIGTSTQAYTLAVGGKVRVSAYGYWVDSGANALQVDGTSSFSDNITLSSGKALLFGTSATQIAGTNAGPMTFRAGSGSTQMTLFSTGNLLIGTTTDAGYKLDVNGTSRFSGLMLIASGLQFGQTGAESYLNTTGATAIQINRKNITVSNGADNQLTIDAGNGGSTITKIFVGGASGTQPICINGNGRETVFGLDTATPSTSALIRMESTTKGFLPPRMTTTQRNAIATPAAGLIVYDTTDNKHYGYNGTAWTAFY